MVAKAGRHVLSRTHLITLSIMSAVPSEDDVESDDLALPPYKKTQKTKKNKAGYQIRVANMSA